MKKTMLTLFTASSLILGSNALAQSDLSTASAFSLIGTGSLIVAVSSIPIFILEDLSSNHHTTNNYYTYNNPPTKMIVNNVTNLNNGKVELDTQVIGKETQNFKVEIAQKVLEDSHLEKGTEIKVAKNEVGYTLNANNKVIGIIPNNNTNKLLKQEKV